MVGCFGIDYSGKVENHIRDNMGNAMKGH